MAPRPPLPFLLSTRVDAGSLVSLEADPAPELSSEPPTSIRAFPEGRSEPPLVIRFGDHEIRTDSEELLRNGRVVHLAPQAVRLLARLAVRHGQVVTRQELRQHLWGDAYVDFEQGLNNSIHRIRAALGDDAQEPRFVETLPRRGYRFLPGVEIHAEGPDEGAVGARRRKARFWTMGGFAALALLLAAVAWLGLRRPAGAQSVVLAIPPIGVPDGSRLRESAGDELAEAITSEFVRRAPASYRVLGRASFALAHRPGTQPDVLVAARRLDATHVLSGTLHGGPDDHLTLNVQLLRLPDGATIWARTQELERSRLLGIERRVVSELGEAFGVDLRIGAPEDDLEGDLADLALQARYHLHTQRRIDAAAELYGQLVERAPRSADVQAGYATALYLKGLRTHEFEAREALIPPLRRALRHALELDPSMPAALTLSGQVATFIDRDPDGGRRWFDRALRAAPNDAMVRLEHSHFLSVSGRHDEAIEEMLLAKRADPESSVAFGNLGMTYFWARRWEEMRSACSLALELNRESLSDFACLLQSLWRLGHHDEARQRALTYFSEDPLRVADDRLEELRRVPADGVPASSVRLFLSQLMLPRGTPDSAGMTSVYTLLGDPEQAGVWLERSVEEESWKLPWLTIDPDLDPLREDPRYAELFARCREPRRWAANDPGRPL